MRCIIETLLLCSFITLLSGCVSSGDTNSKSNTDSTNIVRTDKPISEMTQEEILDSPQFKAKMRELAPVYAKQKVYFKMLCSEWERCKSNKEKHQFIYDNEDEVGEMFDVDISTISKAENLFVTHPEEFLKAMELRLKARACKELAEESYQRAYELKYSD